MPTLSDMRTITNAASLLTALKEPKHFHKHELPNTFQPIKLEKKNVVSLSLSLTFLQKHILIDVFSFSFFRYFFLSIPLAYYKRDGDKQDQHL